MSAGSILTINTGSSSLKAAVFDAALNRTASYSVERIGTSHATATRIAAGQDGAPESAEVPDHAAALRWLTSHLPAHTDIAAIGHRVVHGGSQHMAPERVSDRLIADLDALVPIDPQHLPQAIAAMHAATTTWPEVPQIACFDTWFHRTMPIESTLLPLPQAFYEQGIRRYGFHGLSYESIIAQLETLDPVAVAGRIVICHLGAGSSMVAVRNGASQDTTMGFTPTGGLMMGTRPGDLDPGVLLYLLQSRGMEPGAINELLNKQSGLLGVSGSSQDMRDLLEQAANDEWAERAVGLYCHIARKHLGSLIAVLGGIDTLVFTGGIGEHAPAIRSRICREFGFPGLLLGPEANRRQQAVISAPNSSVIIRVMKANEELAIARHVAAMTSQIGA